MAVVRVLEEVGRADLAAVGGKGANLGELVSAGLPVPPGFVVDTEGYRAFLEANALADVVPALADLDRDASPDVVEAAATTIRAAIEAAAVPAEIREAVAIAYTALGGGPVAVRSSATAEDLADASFAGQQDTYLNVRGLDPLLEAVRACWASLWTGRAVAYRLQRGIPPAEVALAVVVQRMVDAQASGVMFTANPATGRRDQLVVSAAWGLGESVVGGTVSTDDLVLEGASGRVVSRTVADKAVRTVYADTGTAEQPVPDALRHRPVLDDAAAADLATLGERAAAWFGVPQDLEWARADGRFWIVQSRPITALPPAEAPPPTDWTVPEPTAFYVRASIVEQLPNPLTPLFAELVESSVTRSLLKLMNELIGRAVVAPADVSLPTVNGYAYYRYSRAALLRVTLRTFKAVPVLTSTGPRSGITRWRERVHPAYAALVARWRERDPAVLSTSELLDGVVELLDAGTEYYTSVQAVIPIAAMTEAFLTLFYNRLVRRHGDPPAETLLLGFVSEPILADQDLYDLASWSRERPALAGWLTGQDNDQVVRAFSAGIAPTGVDPEVWSTWCDRLRAHLDRFGHAVYDLDFANPVAADEPAAVLDTLRFYLRGEGIDPHERQRSTAARREELARRVSARLDPVRRAAFLRLLHRAQRTAPVREDALADIGLAWPRLRALLLELGRRLVAADAVASADDVFWLRRAEITAALEDRAARNGSPSLDATVEQRREVWRGRRRATPPQILPQGRWYEVMRRFMPAASETQTGDVITGIAGSAGQVTAPARVLSGPADFGRLQPGEVLVAGITTPAWTPLFARAAGVVTDIGGPLSHSSIVAREYGIPAVLGTGVATRRITDGQRITVDGDAGKVRLTVAAS